MKNGTAILEIRLAVSYKEIILLRRYPGEEKSCLQKLYMNVSGSSIHDHQSLETTQMSLNRWIRDEETNKLWYFQSQEYYSAIKRIELLTQDNSQRLNKRSQP